MTTLPDGWEQLGSDLYDADDNRVAWIGLDPSRVWVNGDRTPDELRAIADWMESQ